MHAVGYAVLRPHGDRDQLQPDPVGQEHPRGHGEPLPEVAHEQDHADTRAGEQWQIGSHQGCNGSGCSDHRHGRVRVHGPFQQKTRDPQCRKQQDQQTRAKQAFERAAKHDQEQDVAGEVEYVAVQSRGRDQAIGRQEWLDRKQQGNEPASLHRLHVPIGGQEQGQVDQGHDAHEPRDAPSESACDKVVSIREHGLAAKRRAYVNAFGDWHAAVKVGHCLPLFAVVAQHLLLDRLRLALRTDQEPAVDLQRPLRWFSHLEIRTDQLVEIGTVQRHGEHPVVVGAAEIRAFKLLFLLGQRAQIQVASRADPTVPQGGINCEPTCEKTQELKDGHEVAKISGFAHVGLAPAELVVGGGQGDVHVLGEWQQVGHLAAIVEHHGRVAQPVDQKLRESRDDHHLDQQVLGGPLMEIQGAEVIARSSGGTNQSGPGGQYHEIRQREQIEPGHACHGNVGYRHQDRRDEAAYSDPELLRETLHANLPLFVYHLFYRGKTR